MTTDPEAALIGFINANYQPAFPVTASTELVRSEIVDSYSILELITFIEAEFQLRIPDDEIQADNFRTVDSILVMITQLREPHDAT